MVIITDRFTLRPLEPKDASAIARYANNRDIWLNLLDRFPHPYRLGHAEDWIALQDELTGQAANWAIVVGGEAGGVIGLQFKTDVYRRTAVIGYWLGEPLWGRGITTEAVRRITAYAFEQLDMARVEAEVFEWNSASCRVLEKAGFVREARLRKAIIKNGQLIDAFLYARLSPAASREREGGA